MADVPQHRDRPDEGDQEKRRPSPAASLVGVLRFVLLLGCVVGIMYLAWALDGRLFPLFVVAVVAFSFISHSAASRVDRAMRLRRGQPAVPAPISRARLLLLAGVAVFQWALAISLAVAQLGERAGDGSSAASGVGLCAAAAFITAEAFAQHARRRAAPGIEGNRRPTASPGSHPEGEETA